ncbi:procathepsin L-like [Polypterus senegalus]|uniref:procathepsin L-like n=1 Tax=Polypterus senegalus TaxID=55291 RepID=UPI001963C360|nr:procathepsin L-like [Polypterus senegalus]XP_039617996.1 procathepsin L-like [Polypterus senegalus]XP_039617997.1 procathepsin L-like [Polypterus senegalus]
MKAIFFMVCQALCLYLIVCIDSRLDFKWQVWKKTHGKQYKKANELQKRTIWEENLKKINAHNLQYKRGKTTFKLGMNQFGDLTSSEFASMLSSYSVKHVRDITLSATDLRSAASKLNLTSIDYRKLGYVTPVQDQGTCGCCWAFSAAGAIEGQTFNKTGKLIPLSKQNLLDCAEYLGNQGCTGSRPSLAFQYVIDNGGIQAEATYPYKMAIGSCRFNSSKVAATVANYKYLPIGNEQALADALATIGPISVAIDARQISFQFYLSGIYNDPNCSILNLSHAMLAVGYGFQGSSNYWIIKNSWGTLWGVNGYLMLAKDKNNACGISQYGVVPFV